MDPAITEWFEQAVNGLNWYLIIPGAILYTVGGAVHMVVVMLKGVLAADKEIRLVGVCGIGAAALAFGVMSFGGEAAASLFIMSVLVHFGVIQFAYNMRACRRA